MSAGAAMNRRAGGLSIGLVRCRNCRLANERRLVTFWSAPQTTTHGIESHARDATWVRLVCDVRKRVQQTGVGLVARLGKGCAGGGLSGPSATR